MAGLSNERIAVRLGIEIGTVQKHLLRARGQVRLTMLQEAEHVDR